MNADRFKYKKITTIQVGRLKAVSLLIVRFLLACACPHADRRKPESSIFKQLQTLWTPPGLDPGSTGVTTFYGCIKVWNKIKLY